MEIHETESGQVNGERQRMDIVGVEEEECHSHFVLVQEAFQPQKGHLGTKASVLFQGNGTAFVSTTLWSVLSGYIFRTGSPERAWLHRHGDTEAQRGTWLTWSEPVLRAESSPLTSKTSSLHNSDAILPSTWRRWEMAAWGDLHGRLPVSQDPSPSPLVNRYLEAFLTQKSLTTHVLSSSVPAALFLKALPSASGISPPKQTLWEHGQCSAQDTFGTWLGWLTMAWEAPGSPVVRQAASVSLFSNNRASCLDLFLFPIYLSTSQFLLRYSWHRT